MKKISLYIVAAAMALTSCSDWLQEEPKSFDDGSLTPENVESRVNRLYRQGALIEIANAGSAYVGPTASINGMLTGYFTNSYEGQETQCMYAGKLEREDHTNDLSARVTETSWSRCYNIINVANQVINSEVANAQYKAEAKFFRAFNYFYLVKMFGDVPMLTLFTEGEGENMTMGRTPKADVLNLVKTDLTEAVKDLPNVTFANNGHRISKAVANMALADVALYTKDYQTALTAAKAVIATPGHDLLENGAADEDSYINKLRSTDDNSEVVYALEYNNANSTSGWWPTYAFNASGTAVFDKYSIFERVYGVANGFLNVYEKGDLRVQNQQFFVWEFTNPATGIKWEAPNAETPGSFYYYDAEAMEVTGRGTHDFNIYRLAEAYLIAAEAIAQTSGVTAEATGYLNAIQSRANATLTNTTDKNAFIEAVWTERLREFPLEFKIWDDCVRTAKFPKITENGVNYVDLATATNARGASFAGKSLVWPIGVLQLQRNPNLVQNELYK